MTKCADACAITSESSSMPRRICRSSRFPMVRKLPKGKKSRRWAQRPVKQSRHDGSEQLPHGGSSSCLLLKLLDRQITLTNDSIIPFVLGLALLVARSQIE